MAPRGSSVGASSPTRAASHPAVARRLFDHDQDESSLQESPALSGSGQRRGHRASVYDIPEVDSPAPQTSAVLEESFVQEEITANETESSVVFNGGVEESSIAQIGDDTIDGAENVESLVELEQSEMTPEPVKEPARRGRKRKSDVIETAEDGDSGVVKAHKRGPALAQGSVAQKKGKETLEAPAASSRRSKRVSDMTEQTDQTNQDMSVMDGAVDAPAPPKRRGRLARAKPETKENAAPSKSTKNVTSKAEVGESSAPAKTTKGATGKPKADETFKKPPKPAPKSKEKPKSKERAKSSEQAPTAEDADSGKLVDVHGHPLNKKDIEQMSTTSAGSRYGRGRHLSVFRELEPEAVARVGRTGRHRVAPIDFWRNDRISYDPTGSMTSIVKNQDVEPERKSYKASSGKGKKRNLTAIEEEEVELDPWEEEDGILVGNYRDFDPFTDVTTNDIVEDSKSQHS
jgi:centromere protein C